VGSWAGCSKGRAAAARPSVMTWSRIVSAEERVINPTEAAVVERIFTMFAHGVSPRAIARRLNEENTCQGARTPVAGYHHSRPEGARHRHPQQ
jgi:hypothetical protein